MRNYNKVGLYHSQTDWFGNVLDCGLACAYNISSCLIHPLHVVVMEDHVYSLDSS